VARAIRYIWCACGSRAENGSPAGVAPASRDRYIGAWARESQRPGWVAVMRAEIEKLVDEIKQSVGLLRRHL
jgi:hypothetical protein